MNNALRRQEPLRELERQSESQRMLAPQSEANVCRHKCNLKKSRLLIAQDPNRNSGLGSRTSNAIGDLALFQKACYCRAKLARL